jgi:hypothetical protein
MALSGLAGAPSLRGGGSKRAVASFDDDFDELFGGEDEASKVSGTPARCVRTCNEVGQLLASTLEFACPVILRKCSMAEEAVKRA